MVPYMLEGVYLEFWEGNTEAGPVTRESFMCKRVKPLFPVNGNHCVTMIENMPFAARSFHHDVDFPLGDGSTPYPVDNQPFRFVSFPVGFKDPNDVGHLPGVKDKVGQLYAIFASPDPSNTPCFSYRPVGTDASIPSSWVFCAGKDESDRICDLQVNIHQADDGDSKGKTYVAYTRIYETDLMLLQVSWKVFGKVLMPNMKGYLMCTVNRQETEKLLVRDDVDGVVKLNGKFHPSLADIAKAAGFKLPGNRLQELLPERFGDWSKMVVPDGEFEANPLVRGHMNAVNILAFTGDASPWLQAESMGLVEFFVVANMALEQEEVDELRETDMDNIISVLKSKSSYRGVEGGARFAVFAVGTPSLPCTVNALLHGHPCLTPTEMISPSSSSANREEEEEDEDRAKRLRHADLYQTQPY